MDLTTFTHLFTGSPFKPLRQHRKVVLDTLALLNKQLLNKQLRFSQSTEYCLHTRPDWLAELPVSLEKLEQETLSRLNQTSLTSQPRESVLALMQSQKNLAQLICRMADRLTYRSPALPDHMQIVMRNVCHSFSKAVHHLRLGVQELDALSQPGLRRHHARLTEKVYQQLTLHTDRLTENTSQLKQQTFLDENQLDSMDTALLLLCLEDIDELTAWMKSLLIHLQPN